MSSLIVVIVIYLVAICGIYYIDRKTQVLKNASGWSIGIFYLIMALCLAGGMWLKPTSFAVSDVDEKKESLEAVQKRLAYEKTRLKDYSLKAGGYPSNDVGFAALASTGMLAQPWKEYIVYENRRGMPNSAFSCSLANDDWLKRYSVRVDHGITIYSIEGYYHAQDYRDLWWSTYKVPLVSCLLICIAVALSLIVKGAWATKVWRILTVVLATVAGFYMGNMIQVFCYLRCGLIGRDPRFAAKQLELIEQYHSNGVINAETYRRLMDATAQANDHKLEGQDNAAPNP